MNDKRPKTLTDYNELYRGIHDVKELPPTLQELGILASANVALAYRGVDRYVYVITSLSLITFSIIINMRKR